jgi:hypothetical protein
VTDVSAASAFGLGAVAAQPEKAAEVALRG